MFNFSEETKALAKKTFIVAGITAVCNQTAQYAFQKIKGDTPRDRQRLAAAKAKTVKNR